MINHEIPHYSVISKRHSTLPLYRHYITDTCQSGTSLDHTLISLLFIFIVTKAVESVSFLSVAVTDS